jgi:hypothetical protein
MSDERPRKLNLQYLVWVIVAILLLLLIGRPVGIFLLKFGWPRFVEAFR